MAKKKIINSSNNKAYKIRERTAKKRKKGQIMGLYKDHTNARKIISKRFSEVFKRLSTE